MSKGIRIVLTAVGVLIALSLALAFAQTSDSKMAGKSMPGKMTDQQMMDKLDKMSTDEKAAMFDKMTAKDKMSAMKMAGHDTSKMSSTERLDMMGKMSAHEKADAFDKMPMEKKMSIMHHESTMHKDTKKMDK
jgi:hypothetical protein